MQESQNSITQGTLCAASGNGRFILAGRYGNLAISATAVNFETITTPFGISNINAIEAGDDRFIAVADNGKIGYALFSNPKQWYLIADHPLTGENIRSIKYGSGIWIIVSESGKVITSKQGMVWKEVEANLQTGGTASAFGDTYFIIGDEAGNIRRSLSVAGIFSVVTRAEFAALMAKVLDMTQAEIFAMLEEWERIKAEIEEALSYQLLLADRIPLPPILGGRTGTLTVEVPVLDDEGNPVLDEDENPVTTTKPYNRTLPDDHQHPNDTLALLQQLDRATILDSSSGTPVWPQRSHLWGIPILDMNGKIFAQNQTWQRGEANGIAPLDETTHIPIEFLAEGWAYDSLINALRDKMLQTWSIQDNRIFQDLGEFSRINAFAYSDTTIVAVGEKGRIAWGINTATMQMVTESPFGENDSVVGVAYGSRSDGTKIFVAVSQTHYSTSLNGSDWTESVELSNGIQGVFYGGGFFVIPDVHGNIWRSQWNGNALSFLQQESSQNVTMGVTSIAYLQDKFVGVGINNRIVGTTDPAYWNEEQSPAPADSQWNCVFTGDGFFVAVGNYGRALKGTVDGQWTTINTSTGADLHYGFYEFYHYIIAGKNGTLLSSDNTASWVKRTTKTTSTIRAGGFFGERYFIGTDAGQFIVSRSISDVLYIGSSTPSNEIPNPVGNPIATGYAGDSNKFMRADAVIPDTGVVMEKRVGIPTTYKTVTETTIDPDTGEEIIVEKKIVDRYGVPPLGEDRIVPKEFLPPFDVNINDLNKLEFLQIYSPFNVGINIPSIIHDGAYGNNIHVFAGEKGLAYSKNNSEWAFCVTQPFGNIPAVGAAFGQDDQERDVFVAISTENQFSVSYQGNDLGNAWDEVSTINGDYDFEAVCYYNRFFIILCSNGVVLRSTDLVYWTEQADSPNITAFCNDIEGGNDVIVVVGNTGRICISDDASHFVVADSPSLEDLLTVTFGSGTFLIGGENNTLLKGTGADDFVPVSSPFENNAAITGTGYEPDRGLFIVTNAEGQIATTTDFILWELYEPKPTIVRIKAIVSGAGRIFLGDDSGNIFTGRTAWMINGIGGGNGGTVNGTIAWENVTNKPNTFTPKSHTHTVSEITDINEWIANIVSDGEITVVGKSAYQSWLEIAGNGNKTEAEFVAWLKGNEGKSAYQSWLDNGNTGTIDDFFNFLKSDAVNVWIGGNVTVNQDGTLNANLLDENSEPNSELVEHIIPLEIIPDKMPILGYVVEVSPGAQTCTVIPFGIMKLIVAKYYAVNPIKGNTVIVTFQNNEYAAVVINDGIYDPGDDTYIISQE
ncbi:MAG: hypothetical protein LBF88_07115 [Planctomycetaceae bacterium]|jgi:hypothetical protein|nr:hypothetical protein [Planctomycetaceae bacterium]